MDIDREESCAASVLPPGVPVDLQGYEWVRNKVGESGAAVYRLRGKSGVSDLFLKQGRGPLADDLADEMVRLRWLAQYVSVPTIEYFATIPGEAWLLMTALPGKSAYQVLAEQPEDRMAVVDALADFLRRFHTIPAGNCPFSSDHAFRLNLARERIDAGLVREDDFDEEREGWTAEQVWNVLQGLLPIAPDPVVTHGDFSLDNILMVDGKVVGCIDTGRAGVADRYQDIAIVWNCLADFGGDLQDRFIRRYGISAPDQDKLLFHLMLDELF